MSEKNIGNLLIESKYGKSVTKTKENFVFQERKEGSALNNFEEFEM